MPKMTMVIKDVADIPVRTPPTSPGIITKVLLDETISKSMRAGIMSWAPGTKSQTQPHYHSVEELQIVLHGHAALEDCNGKKHALGPGSMFLCPPGKCGAHAIENTGDFPMTLFFVYPRQVFETVKYERALGERHRNKIILQDVKDVKPLTPEQFPLVSVKIICNKENADSLYAGIMWWQAGCKLTGHQPHYHSVEEFQWVLSGNATLSDCNQRTHPLSEGVMFLCPPGVGGVHGIENTSDYPMSLLFVYPEQNPQSTPYPAAP